MKLSDIATIKSGHPFRGAIKDSIGGDTIVVLGKGINREFGIDWDNAPKVILDTKKEPDWLKADDILVAARGTSNYAVHLSDVPNSQTLCSPQFFVIRIKSEFALAGFIAWQLNQDKCQQHFDNTRTGVTVGNLTRQSLSDAPVILPELSKQTKIVALQDTINQEKSALSQLSSNLDQHMKAIASSILSGNSNKGIAK